VQVRRRCGVNGAERGRGCGPWTVAVSLREEEVLWRGRGGGEVVVVVERDEGEGESSR